MEPDTPAITQHLKRLILHQDDQRYSLQEGGDYYPQPEILTDETLKGHLAGALTLGIKLIQPRTQLVKAGAVDLDADTTDRADLEAALEDGRRVQAAAAALGLPAYLEFSGRRGWHVWVFTQDPLPARTMRRLLAHLAERGGCPRAEVFPAGDRITDDGRGGSGAQPFKLPCGLHRAERGGWAGFVGDEIAWGEDGRPILPDQAPLLEAMKQATLEQVRAALPLEQAPEAPASKDRPTDLSKLGEAEPACITWLRKNGAPLDQAYNAVNLTLARYVVSRGLGEDAALLLAGEVAQATLPEHPTEKRDPEEKLRNFRSALRTARQDPGRYSFACSYIRASREMVAGGGCRGSRCPAWPYRTGEDLGPAPRPASPADSLAEREALAFLLNRPDEALPLTLQRHIPPEAFRTLHGPEGEEPRHRHVWEAALGLLGARQELRLSTLLARWEGVQAAPTTADQGLWLEALLGAPTCSLQTFEKHLERLRDAGLRELLARGLRDAGEGVKQAEPLPNTLNALITSCQQLQKRGASSLLPMEERTGGLLRDLLTRPNLKIPTPSGWLNYALNGGWLPGRLYVLGAPPGSGKTTFAAWAADYAAANGTPVLFVSFEMSEEQLWVYSLARIGGINSALLEAQRWEDEKYSGAQELAGQMQGAAMRYQTEIAPRITILEAGPEATPAFLVGAVGQVRAQAGLEDGAPLLLVIDYLQLMNAGEEALDSGTNETQKISRIATSLKQLARDTGAAVLAISDITKASYQDALKTGELDMGALRDSFKIAHAGDVILALLSEDYTPKAPKGQQTTARNPLQLARDHAPPDSKKARALAMVENQHPLNPAIKSSYARLSILKNRGGRRADPLFVYERAYHRFTPIDLEADIWEETEEDDETFT